jgi:hypothetical protein
VSIIETLVKVANSVQRDIGLRLDSSAEDRRVLGLPFWRLVDNAATRLRQLQHIRDA